MKFAIHRAPIPDGLRVAVEGEVDVFTAPEMRAQLTGALRSHRLVTVDLSAVTFMDSQGLSALIRAWEEAESLDGCLRLDKVPPRVMKLLELTGLDTVLTVDSVLPEH